MLVRLLLACALLASGAHGFATPNRLPSTTAATSLLTNKQRPMASPAVRDVAAAALKKVRTPFRKLGYWFTYADLRPFDEFTLEGQLFLGTNVLFFVVGAVLATSGGDPFLGLLCELAGTFSVGYHYAQVRLGGTNKPLVQLAVAFDYLFAVPTLLFGLKYALSLGAALPVGAVVLSGLAFACLFAAWWWDSPLQYLVLHGLWHVFGCLAALQLSAAHATLVG